MSWDAVILRIRGPFRPAEGVVADDYLQLGTTAVVAAAVRATFPDARWDDATYAHRVLDEYTAMTIDLDSVESTHSIHVRVSGPGNPVPDLLSLANPNGWVVLDCSSAQFIDPAGVASEGFEGYRSHWKRLPNHDGLDVW